jgi:hypothetical protein
VLDVEFKDDLSRYRAGHGAKNMAVIRRFSLGLIRADKSKGASKPAENRRAGIRISSSSPTNEIDR